MGTWVFTNLSGNDSFKYTSQTLNEAATYSYNTTTDSLTASIIDSGNTLPTVKNIKVISETWTFSTDGSYAINETYATASGSTQAVVDTGSWAYVDNAQTNSGFYLSGTGSNVLSYIVPIMTSTGVYNFKVKGTTMTLSDIQNQYYTSGYTEGTNITVIFTKQ